MVLLLWALLSSSLGSTLLLSLLLLVNFLSTLSNALLEYPKWEILISNSVPKWALDQVERKFTNRSKDNSNVEPREEDSNTPSSNTIGRDPTKNKYKKGHIVIPYIHGLGESIRKICKKYGIETHSMVIKSLRKYWSNLKTRILQTGTVGPSTGICVGNSHAMRST